ncbi:Zinc finger protein 462 [Collichthys lucidus]|uniref:Zinc finger protein 462 n=1 Tax=Collichthys lucidus TaxID=240159 RepID=A0A4U5UXE3_COLLU|nr:Zinc finger protein 462 [Collichthys lucidus]
MHVHYQKYHPDEAVTIDKIKQSAHVKSHTTSQMVTNRLSNCVTVEEPQKSASYSSVKETRNEADTVSREKMSFPLRNPKDEPETSKTHSESPKTKELTFSADRSKGMNLPTEHSGSSTGMDNLSSSSPNILFYCQICSYSSTNVRSVVGHHNAKHTTSAPTDFEKVIRYSAKMQKNKLQSEAKAKLSDSKPEPVVVEVCTKTELKHKENVAADASVTTTFNPYACAEKLFYCQKCNYGNVSVFGVLSHQSKVHQSINSSRESIIEHTALIHDQIEKSKSQAKELDFATYLPLPLINEGDGDMFFCHFCNYRQNSVKLVLRHYMKKHRGFVISGEQVRLYTSMVFKQTGNEKKKLVSASPSTEASQTQRTLQCQRCTYKTQYVCLLKRHLQKIHKSSHSVTDVLRVCFKQGTLQTGYHCELCVFSHKEAAAVYEHYQEQHPEHGPSLEYVTTRLYVGPKTCISKKKKPQRKHTDGISEGDDTDGSIPSQDETKTYSCRACSFKSSSMSVITRHYRAVHPWAVKEDGSVLDVISGKKQSVIRQVEDQSEIPVTFETYQVPLEFDNAQDSSHEATEKFKCHICSAMFPTQRSLNIHFGMKHQEDVTENLDELKEKSEQLQTRLHVFKCPHCTYVNTGHQGVLTHCQMKHPALAYRADSLYVDEARSHNCLKRNGPDLKLRGYMCKTCPHIYATMEKLNKHCERDHSGAVTNASISAGTKKNQYKSHSVQGSKVSKASFLSKKLRCQHCSYTCSTKLGIARHVHFHHNNSSSSHSRDSLFRCTLCSRSYFRKKRLGNHYINKHGKESFLKYYLPVYKQGHEKSAVLVPDHPSTQQPENSSEARQSNATAEKNKILVYKCPNCCYVNSSYHGTLTHCQMRHPDLIARADELQTHEILSTNMVSCKVAKSSNERGYLCAKCPQVHASVKKLKIHCARDHSRDQADASEHSVDTETEQPDDDSVLEADSTAIGLSPELGSPETCQTSLPLVKNNEILYKCHICNYMGMRRRYLYSHYKKTHKFDAIATCKLLQRYNKDKRNQAVNLPESEESADVKCKMCPNLKFDSSQLLIEHYSTFHSSDCISDFTVLSQASKRTTGLYKCAHCMKQMNGIKKLCYHLDRHREKKMAEAAKTKTSSVIQTSPEAETTELCREDEMPMLETVEELTQWNVAPVATLNLPPSPLSSHSKPTDLEEPEPKSREHTCKQCERTFMSLRGLRSHERSHAALASIKKLNNLSTSALKHNVKKYLLYKAGTIRPFLCSVCSFRTTVMDLWKCHFMKKHQEMSLWIWLRLTT